MNNPEKDQLAVKAFYYTKASELGLREANKLVQYYSRDCQWVDINLLCGDLPIEVTPLIRIKPTDVMGSADVYYCPPNGDKEDLGGNYTYATKDMVLVDRDELEAMYNQLTEYSYNEYIDSGDSDWFLLEDIKNKYNL